ncbi:hypothetical protein CEB3_c46260 [Peptococcaceae bacterium CEB3]|nr:hypothetical protein CEB3_c46260 [Peptococcaceae bacterium CEB3]
MRRLAIPMMVLIILFGSALLGVRASEAQTYVPIDYNALHQKFGMTVRASAINPAISSDQVKTIASTLPEYSPNGNVHYELVHMTYPGFGCFSQIALAKDPKLKRDGYINDLPVWLISFQGLRIPSSSRKTTVYDHETVYVIDAASGEELLGFNYR